MHFFTCNVLWNIVLVVSRFKT